jgi:hypothetical protein
MRTDPAARMPPQLRFGEERAGFKTGKHSSRHRRGQAISHSLQINRQPLEPQARRQVRSALSWSISLP